MRILLVEDHPTMGPELVKSVQLMDNVDSVELVRSKDMGEQALKDDFYDLLILDLKIPTVDDGTDEAIDHGKDLFQIAQERCGGLPIIVLTAQGDREWAERLGRFGDRLDLWGSGAKTSTVDYIRKENVEEVYKEVERIASEVAVVNAIRLNTRGRNLGLSRAAARAIRIAVRLAGGVTAEVSPLNGGLSRVQVYLVKISDGSGARLQTLAAKLGNLDEVRAEMVAYDRYVMSLPIGAFPHLVRNLEAGLCGEGAIFYRLAENYGQSLFGLLAADQSSAIGVIEHLKAQMKVWIDGATVQSRTIAEIRRHVIWDTEFEVLCAEHALDLADIEAMTVSIRVGCTHGDLHGGNVLISQAPAGIIIDFGEVGETALPLDPVTLELSMVFHPDGPGHLLIDDIPAYLEHWPNYDALPDIGVGPYLRACRDWSYDVAQDDLSVLASAYAYAVRQLRFDTVPAATTLKLVSSVAHALRAARSGAT